MTKITRIGLAVLLGWAFQIGVLVLFFSLDLPKLLGQILLWNVGLVFWFMGSPGLMGYDASGNPVYEGTPADGIYFVVGILLGFVIYPLLSYWVLGWFSAGRTKNIE